MFGIGWPEFIVIFLVLLIFVGPRQFPGLLQKIGQVVAQLRSASRELRNQLDPELMNLESPRNMARKYGREVIDEWTSPYSEAMEEAKLPRLDQLDPPPENKVEAKPAPDETVDPQPKVEPVEAVETPSDADKEDTEGDDEGR